MYDIIIKNGQIVDGSGTSAYLGHIAVKDGKIAGIWPLGAISEEALENQAGRVIDASGCQVTPGFIDNHSHSDDSVFTGSDSYNYLEQGVTTQIAGQCGDSPAPYYEGAFNSYKNRCSEEVINSMIEISRTPSSFMAAAEKQTFGTNYAFFVGHGSLRGKAMGYSGDRASAEQMACMKEMLKDAMDAGFLGFTSGLVYAPSVYGDEEELSELAKVMVPYNGIYASHIRGEGNNVLRAVKEAIAIGEKAGVEVLISHLKVMGLHNEGMSEKLLAEIDAANERGVVVNADQYPYVASSAPLLSQIPPKYLVDGHDAYMKRLADPAMRKQMDWSIFNEVDEFESGIYSAGYGGALVVGASITPQYVNKTIGQIAAEEGKEPIDALCDLLIANDGNAQGVYFNQCPTDLLRIMRHPKVFCGSDWSDYPDSRYDPEKEGGGHPRATATTIRRLELVRDFRLRTMEDSVKNLTYDTAKAMHLEGIGLLKEGYSADICVCHYDKLHSRADFAHPYRENEGIEYVLVNGALAVEHGHCTKVRNGRVLKRG